MIDVKGSKTQAQETDPAQRYVLKNAERKSKIPVAFGLFLAGVAVYLKSIFPSQAAPDATLPAEEEAAPAGSPEPRMAEGEAVQMPLDELQTGTTPGGYGAATKVGLLMNYGVPDFDLTVEWPLANFMQPAEDNLTWNGFVAPSFDAANDNSSGISVPGPIGGPPPTDNPDDGGTDPDDGGTDPNEPEPPCDGTGPCDDDDEDDDDDTETVNRAPRVSGPVYLADVTGCAILVIALADLLRNAVDPDGDALSVKNLVVSSGSIVQSAEGWVFQAGPQMTGPVSISYEITDGMFTIAQMAHFSVVRSFIEGTGGDDMLLGTMCADDIDGGAGDDNIDARSGIDVIDGGAGNDHIVAGAGDDTVFGGTGNDIVFGGAGADRISGGTGNDRLYGEDGDDAVFGDGGHDYLSGGEGNDLLAGGAGNDVIEGNADDDTIEGGAGADELFGNAGNDVLADGAGKDRTFGGDGDDHVVAALDGDDDRHDGGDDFDTVDYSATEQGIAINFSTQVAAGAEIGTDRISRFEAAIGGSGDDTITGCAEDEVLIGNGGDDEISGGGGDDRIEGGDGCDTLADGQGEDTVHGGDGNDHIVAALDGADDFYDGGEDCDTIDYSHTSEGVTVDFLAGTACGVEIGEDTISGFETAVGGDGDDHFIVGSDPAVLVGGGGENTFEFVPTDPAPAAEPVIHEILDFRFGDRIRMSKYDIFERVFDEMEDRFEDIYGDDIDDDDASIRYRHERTDELDRTIIEADFNNDDIYETTIQLQGRHVLVIVEQA